MELRPRNAYTFQSTRALRVALSHYRALEISAKDGDLVSATTLLDLTRALGMADGVVSAVTPRQREAITLLLIEDQPVSKVAKSMRIAPRTVYFIVDDGLRRLLRYLQDGENPREWQPWQEHYVRHNAHRPRRELASHIGKSIGAVWMFLWRCRKNGEVFADRASSQSIARSA